ncbi:MAG: PEP-CTERM sorting domain-containing protein [Akkermansiaceae bacterium]|nr:PEP-CTERM sorting domain-containing protein [Akkermansiaceae bacterium]
MKIKSLFAVALVGLALASTAHAATSQYNLIYSGQDFGNTASAFVTFTADDSVINGDAGTVIYGDPAAITDFSMIVQGSSGFDGSYDLTGQVSHFYMQANGVDTSTNWVGQSGFKGFVFDSPITYAFNWDALALYSPGVGSNDLLLTSMIGGPGASQSVPEPSALALLGLGTVGFIARRRRN